MFWWEIVEVPPVPSWARAESRAGFRNHLRLIALTVPGSHKRQRGFFRPPRNAKGPTRASPVSWRKLVESLPVPSGARAECRAEFRIHGRLIAIPVLGSKNRQRSFFAPQRKAQAHKATSTLESADRQASPRAKSLSHVD